MSRITINSNISSLNSQRSLFNATKKLQDSYTRLSSGLRITRASDDAAGLSISENLKADTRLQNQGIKNLNDGVSLLNIADGALNELSGIMIRLNELAEQAANGTLGYKQRMALDQEAQSLSKEYNRIARSTEFNGRKIFDGNFGTVNLVAGGGRDTIIFEDLGGAIGDGSFVQHDLISTTANLNGITLHDLNGDNNLDLVATSAGSGVVSVKLGNGNGYFTANHFQQSLSGNLGVSKIVDINKDGFDDILVVDNSNADLKILFGNGNGTFKNNTSYNISSSESLNGLLVMEDINNDGNLDALTSSANSFYVSLSNSNGTFKTAQSYVSGVDIHGFDAKDLDNDGFLDIAYTSITTSTYSIMKGTSHGSFSSSISYARQGGALRGTMKISDFNSDGIADLSVTNESNQSIGIFIGNGDLSFKSVGSYFLSVSNPQSHIVADFNGDGNQDIIGLSTTSQGFSVILGNSDGTFNKNNTYAAPYFTTSIQTADINNDGALDILTGATSNMLIFLGNSNSGVSALQSFSLKTQHSARESMTYLRKSLNEIGKQRGHIGAFQSRVEAATSNLYQSTNNYQDAYSRIVDADVAEESSKLVANQILQQAASGVLRQANQQPQIALKLLTEL